MIPDRVLSLVFVALLCISFTMDLIPFFSGPGLITRAKLVNAPWPPSLVVDAFFFWAESDPLLAANPVWLDVMGMASFLYQPFYFAAVYVFWKGRGEWIRTPALVWGGMMAYSVVIILAEEHHGQHKAPNFLPVLAAYIGYIIIPFYVICRVGRPGPVFPQKLKVA